MNTQPVYPDGAKPAWSNGGQSGFQNNPKFQQIKTDLTQYAPDLTMQSMFQQLHALGRPSGPGGFITNLDTVLTNNHVSASGINALNTDFRNLHSGQTGPS